MKRTRKIGSILMILAMTVAFCAGCGAQGGGSEGQNAGTSGGSKDGGEVYTVKLANVFADDNPFAKGQVWLAEELEKRSGGRFACTVFGNGQLASGDKEGTEICANGTVQVSYCTLFTLASMGGGAMTDEQILEMGYLFEDSQELYDFMDNTDFGKGIMESASNTLKVGVVPGGVLQGREAILVKDIVTAPSDMAGKKIRTHGGLNCNNLVAALGASPLAMSFGEVYTGLQQGTVDGAYSNVQNFWYQKFYEVADSVVCLDLKTNLTAILYNMEFVESLPDDLREIWDSTMLEFNEKLRSLVAESDDYCIEQLSANCESVIIPEGESLDAWADPCKSAWTDAIEVMGFDRFEQAMTEAGKDIPAQYKQ